MLKQIIDELQKKLGDDVNVFYQRGNVYVDYPHQKKGKYFDANDTPSLLAEIFNVSIYQEMGNTFILVSEDEEDIEFTYNQNKDGVRTLNRIVGMSSPINREVVELIVKEFLN